MFLCRHRSVILVVGLLLGLATGCKSASPGADDPTASGPLTLEQLPAGDDAKASGQRLMALALGLHRLDTATPMPTRAVIGVHGYGSEGYEWVHPLRTLGGDAQVYFYRWDFTQCPEPRAAALGTAIDGLIAAQPELASIQVVAHSYGGVVAALAASRYHGRVPLLVELVASPLAGHPGISRECSYGGAMAPATDAPVTLRQWRTRQDLDAAFRDIDPDPQVVELPGEVTVLPESYRGHRLGHNWSLSWVADHLAGDAPP